MNAELAGIGFNRTSTLDTAVNRKPPAAYGRRQHCAMPPGALSKDTAGTYRGAH
jgi:hypothetical protein